jgi:DNA processing protein
LLTSVDDILSELNYLDGFRPRAITTPGETSVLEQLMPPLSEPEQKVLSAFAGGSILSVDALTSATSLSAAEVSVALMGLELKKLIAKRSDGAFEERGR